MSAQRVPAWKRLGLKLKGAASDDSPALPANGIANPKSRPNAASTAGSPANGTSNKRNLTPSAYSSPSHSSYQPASKRLRTSDRSSGTARDTSHLRSHKSVSFASGTKDSSTRPPHDAKNAAKNKKQKKKQKPKAPAEPAPEFDLTPTLSYLRQWAAARDAWKFNKNHQTLLIKYIFDGAPRVPSADLNTFLEYIRDLKGGVRNRLRETAAEIRKKDMADGAAGFAADMPEKEAKQRRYDEVIGRFLQEQKEARQSRIADGPARTPNKRSFDEVELVLRTAEPDLKQRLIKRIRAELVLEELTDSDESASSEQTTTTASSTQDGAVADNEMDVDEKPAKGPQPKAKRRRLRNLRTANVQLSSSSESESESESDEASDDEGSSSESSSEDDTDDLEMGEPNEAESSSSSSSSSEGEESESGSDDDSDEDD